MKRLLLVVLMVLAGMSLYSCATTSSLTSIPLPEDVQIVPPDPNLPPEIKAFSGKWSGRWGSPGGLSGGLMDTVLIVEKINNEHQATVISCRADSTQKDCQVRIIANFSKNEKGTTLSFKGQSGNIGDFRVVGDMLEGASTFMYNTKIYPALITMKRIQ